MQNFDLENIDCHATLAMIEKQWGFPRRTLRALLGMTENTQSGRSLLPESGADAPTILSAVYTDSTPAKNRQADVPQYGRSMIEMLGVLAIIGVLSVGGIAGYSKAMTKYRINKTIEQISLITANIRSFYSSQKGGVDDWGDPIGKYCEINNTILRKAKLVPDEMWNSDKTAMENAFGGKVGIYGDWNEDYTIFGSTFVVDYTGIPEEACIELVTHDWPDDFNGIFAGDYEFYGSNQYVLTYDCADIGSESSIGSIRACKKDRGIPASMDDAVIGCTCTEHKTCSVIFAAQ